MQRGYVESEKSAGTIMKRASTQNRLQDRKESLERELKAVNDALDLFSKHPEIADALDLLGQISI